MNKQKLSRVLFIFAAILIITAIMFTSCSFFRDSGPTDESEKVIMQTEKEKRPETEKTTEKITTEETTTEPETETESETEETSETTEEETVWYDETVVFEEIIFGEYIPPETDPPETEIVMTPPETDYNFPLYDPTVPSGDGYAPLALMYHLVLDEPFSDLESLFVRPAELEGHIQALIEKGYAFIFADEYAYSDRKTVIMSFDDGYIDNYTEMFPIIKKYNVKVTVFMVGGYINGNGFLTSDMIKEMSDSGLVSFQSHTLNHAGLTSLSPDSLRYEFEQSKYVIENITGRDVKAICYPSGRYNDAVLAIADEYFDFGYTTVSRTSTAGYPSLELPRLRVSRGFGKSYFKGILP